MYKGRDQASANVPSSSAALALTPLRRHDEEHLISSVLVLPTKARLNAELAMQQITPDSFQDERCRRIWTAIESNIRAGVEPSVPEIIRTLFTSTGRSAPEDQAYIVELATARAPTDGNLDTYIARVRGDQARPGPPIIRDLLTEAFDRMERRAAGEEKPISLPWSDVNNLLAGGFWPGLYVLVGNTGSGKSQWALQASLEAAGTGTPVVYVGLELGRVDLIARLLGMILHRRWSGLFLGQDEIGLQKSRSLIKTLEALPLHLEVGSPLGWAHTEMRRIAENMRRLYPETKDGVHVPGSRPMLMVLDFLQLVAGDERELRERIARAAYSARAIARDLNITVLLISSTARENYAVLDEDLRKSGAPRGKTLSLGEGNPSRLVGLGKESGEIEFAADAVLVLARTPWPDDAAPPDESEVWCAVAKARAGQGGWAKLYFDGGRFRDEREVSSGAIHSTSIPSGLV